MGLYQAELVGAGLLGAGLAGAGADHALATGALAATAVLGRLTETRSTTRGFPSTNTTLEPTRRDLPGETNAMSTGAAVLQSWRE